MSSLVADYGESSHESSEDSESDNNSDKPDTGASRLPPPAFTDKIKNSVFVNPYLEAENAQFAVLEKHVKMVPQNNNIKGSQKVCWMFKKGKCRFGKKCKFSHVEDNILKNNTNQDIKDSDVTDQHAKINNEDFSEEENYSDEDECNKKRKKHPGLTQGLIPSKKVIKMYKKHKGEASK